METLVASPLVNFLELALREKNDCAKLPLERVSLSWMPETLLELGERRPRPAVEGVGERMEGAMLGSSGSDVSMAFGLGLGTDLGSDWVWGRLWVVVNGFWEVGEGRGTWVLSVSRGGRAHLRQVRESWDRLLESPQESISCSVVASPEVWQQKVFQDRRDLNRPQ